MSTSDDYRSLIHTPADLAVEFIDYARKIKSNPGISWGVASMDKVMIPMRPGDVVGVIARPGHGKSTTAAYLARHIGKQLAESGDKDKCVVYVTFEQSIEEIESMFEIDGNSGYDLSDVAWGRADIDAMIRSSVKRLSLPVVLIGKSQSRRKQTPRMTVDNVYKALASLEVDYGVKPVLVILDYIQIIPVENARDRITQVGEAIVRSKELAIDIGAPILFCVQAGRKVDDYGEKIPTASDCQWASAIEQTADKLIGIWRPVLTEDKDAVLSIEGREVKITQNLFIARLLKQRMAQAGHTFVLNFAPQYVRLSDMEINHADLNL
ncbi:MAG: hypothetical protein IPO08_20505 [Xanthomonadales bacterium]|nr:hypothetical protein [Xanthomonadales bacterium]